MGCCQSRQQQQGVEGGNAGGVTAPGAEQQGHPPNFFSRMTASVGRGSPRQNNVVPVSEGLFTGSGNAEPPVRRSASNWAPKMHNTQTVRSLVNLKKHTLRLIADSSNPGSYRLSFVVDSSVPCRVMIYIMAYEKDQEKPDAPPRLKSKHSKREPSVVVNLNGLEQPYCMPPGEGLPFGIFEEEQLTVRPCASAQVYPVVVRLQTLPSGEDKAGTSMQAQTTFATLVKQGDGAYDIQVLKQVLWVNGTSYVLHEIFGIDRSSEEENGGVVDGNKECVICLAETRDTLALPCRHLCLCSDCAKALRYQSNKCPICRTVVQSLLQIKLANGTVATNGLRTGASAPEETRTKPPPGVDREATEREQGRRRSESQIRRVGSGHRVDIDGKSLDSTDIYGKSEHEQGRKDSESQIRKVGSGHHVDIHDNPSGSSSPML